MLSNYRFIYELDEGNIRDLLKLYENEAWSKNRKPEDVGKMLKNSWIIAIINSGNGDLIAFARVLTDFIYRGFIYDVIVAESYRGLGFGRLIVSNIVNNKTFKNVERIELNCIDSNVPFYEKLGFDKVPDGTNMMRYRRN